MKKLELIAFILSSTLVEISISVSLYTIISDAEHVLNDNRIPKKLQPVELMVDATNSLGATILDLHSKNNKNNIAFSPCGLMSVLVALYEGSGGKSAIELKEALNFPHERDIVRIGVRDIHRRLRSYFYKKENLLSGLIFNKENITIRPEYETVLRFYGYDLDGGSMLREDGGNMTNATEATDATPSTVIPIPSTTTLSSNDTSTSGEDLTTTEPSEAETIPTEVTNGNEEGDDEEVTTVAPTRKRRGQLGRRKEKKQSVVIKNPTIPRRSRSYYVLLDEDYENEFHVELPTPSATLATTAITTSASTHHHLHHHHFEPSSTPIPQLPTSSRASVGKYRNSINKELFENTNSDSIEHIFYLNEYDTVRVPYKLYDTVMKYAYVNSLQASFLEIDLDSDYYNLILIVPDFHDGLNNLAHKLRAHEANTIRYIRNSMEFYWVKTIVPKFNLKGNTVMTNDLQNMNINDIFEPTKADFSSLAEDKNLYVKNVEQMININIRTQTMQQLKKISSLYKRPIEVPVNIPFIYCVVDKKLDLIIILGRILNPLNSRIQ